MSGFNSFADFYPYYLAEHANKVCRRLHFFGSCLALLLLVSAVTLANPWLILVAFVQGYFFAWVGHFGFEKNRPATFKHPFYSFLGDWVMFRDMLIGRIPF